MLPGVLVNFSRGLLVRFVVSGVVGSLLIAGSRAFVRVNYGGPPPPPWPDLDSYGRYYLVSLCLTGLIATFYASGQSGRWHAKLCAPVAGCVVLAMVGNLFSWLFPRELVLLEKWEYCTIIVGTPLFALFLWSFPFMQDDKGDAERPPSGSPSA